MSGLSAFSTRRRALRLAIAVECRGIDVVDAELDGARHGALLVARIALGHKAADCAGAEAQHAHL
jgi:hypothetical protein